MELIEETLDEIKQRGKGPDDVLWVGSRDGKKAISFDEFVSLGPIHYDNDFGNAEIATDLVVVFRDGSYLDRGEYDGSEWWDYHTTPIKQEGARMFFKVCNLDWDRLSK